MERLRIAAWPPFHTAEDRDDFVSRLAWYLFPWRDRLAEIRYFVPPPLSGAEARIPDYMDGAIGQRLAAVSPLLVASTAPALAKPFDIVSEGIADRVLLWDRDGVPERRLRRLRPSGKVVDADRHRNRYEGSALLRFGRESIASLTPGDISAEANRTFADFAGRFGGGRYLLIGTGPSLLDFKQSRFDFTGVRTIAVNSMVRDPEFLRRANAIAIAACDPIYHAGCSRYAARFRSDLIRCLDTLSEVRLFVVSRDYEQYRSFVPDRFHDRIIPLAQLPRTEPPGLDLGARLAVAPTSNVLTLALLPLAATLADEVMLAGCDGRPSSEGHHFWSHDRTSQYADEMDDIKRCHPAFFAIDYADYYSEHCATVAEYLAAIERRGRSVRSLTRSHIPALADRFRAAWEGG